MMKELYEDGRQNQLATQVGWPAFKRARRLKNTAHRDNCYDESQEGKQLSIRRPRNKSNKTVVKRVKFSSCDNNMNLSSCRMMLPRGPALERKAEVLVRRNQRTLATNSIQLKSVWSCATLRTVVISLILLIELFDLFHGDLNLNYHSKPQHRDTWRRSSVGAVEGSLIIGDSAIEIQEVEDSGNSNNQAAQNDQQQRSIQQQQQQQSSQPQADQFENSNVVLGTTGGYRQQQQQISSGQPLTAAQSTDQQGTTLNAQFEGENNGQPKRGSANLEMSRLPSGPLPPLSKQTEDITDGDKKSRGNHDYDLNELAAVGTTDGNEKMALNDVLLGTRRPLDTDDDSSSGMSKTITGKVVDFELQPAGGHNKAKIKKKKKKKKKEEEMFKKWGKKKKIEKKAMEKEEKKHMKKKKEEGKKGKKKWGVEEHGQKKNGKFKKKKWGKKVKKGKGVKKGKKGKKFLKDKGHKNTGFKTVYHKEEWGKSSKWHDIKREKKWDEKSKKYKKKWTKEKGKKYKGDHMKKFEKKKKEGKKYKKAKKEKYKKFKKEEFEKGKKKKMEEHKKKKEGGVKKEEKKMEKKKKKKKP